MFSIQNIRNSINIPINNNSNKLKLPTKKQQELLNKIKFNQKLEEIPTFDKPIIVSKRYKTISKYTKEQLAEIVELADKTLKTKKIDTGTFDYEGEHIDFVAYKQNNQLHYKFFVTGTTKIAAGAGGTIHSSQKISSGKKTVEKKSHETEFELESFQNEIQILKLANHRIDVNAKKLNKSYYEAFEISKSGKLRCKVIVPNPSFVSHDRFHMKEYTLNATSFVESKPDIIYRNIVATDMIMSSAILNKVQIAHRDKKLLNYFIDNRGRAALGDFGESVSLTNLPRDLKQVSIPIGTPQYNSPDIINKLAEDVENNDHDSFKEHILDLENYALGVCLYELYTQKSPYVQDRHDAKAARVGQANMVGMPLKQNWKTRNEFVKNVPEDLQPFIIDLLEGKRVNLDQMYAQARKL